MNKLTPEVYSQLSYTDYYLALKIQEFQLDSNSGIKGKFNRHILPRILACTLPIFKLFDVFVNLGKISCNLLQKVKIRCTVSKVENLGVYFNKIGQHLSDIVKFPKFIIDPFSLVKKINISSSTYEKIQFDAPLESIGKKFGTQDKPLIKINFKYFWTHFDIEAFLKSWNVTNNYQFIISDEPDYVFFSVFKPGNCIPFSVPELKGNFTRIFFSAENVRPDMNRCEWAFTTDYDEELQHPNHLRFPTYKFASLHTCPQLLDQDSINNVKKQKIKFCNFLYSNQVLFRNRFFQKLNAYKHIDAPGCCCNNMPPLGANNPIDSRNKPNWSQEKYEFLKQYKFTISIENELQKGYTTEKLSDPLSINSVPIYWGNPLVDRDFNPKKFIHLSPEEYNENEDVMIDRLVKKVIEVDQNDELYEAYLKEPIFKDNKPNKYIDENTFSERMRQIFKS